MIDFDSYLNSADHLKTLEVTQSFYQTAMKSDIFGKVDFTEDKVNQSTNSGSTPF